MGESKILRKGLVVTLLAFLCGIVTAYAFSSVGHERWQSRMEKGKYKGVVDDEPRSTHQNIHVIVSDPIQIPVNTDGPATDTDVEPIEPDEIVGK